MTHDYTHCLDYDETCPKTCFRAKLAEELEKRREEFVGIPLSFSHLKGTFLCDWYSEDKSTHEICETDLVGKTITEISIDGHGILMTVDDGTTLYYDASDGGYSAWEIYMKGADDEE